MIHSSRHVFCLYTSSEGSSGAAGSSHIRCRVPSSSTNSSSSRRPADLSHDAGCLKKRNLLRPAPGGEQCCWVMRNWPVPHHRAVRAIAQWHRLAHLCALTMKIHELPMMPRTISSELAATSSQAQRTPGVVKVRQPGGTQLPPLGNSPVGGVKNAARDVLRQRKGCTAALKC